MHAPTGIQARATFRVSAAHRGINISCTANHFRLLMISRTLGFVSTPIAALVYTRLHAHCAPPITHCCNPIHPLPITVTESGTIPCACIRLRAPSPAHCARCLPPSRALPPSVPPSVPPSLRAIARAHRPLRLHLPARAVSRAPCPSLRRPPSCSRRPARLHSPARAVSQENASPSIFLPPSLYPSLPDSLTHSLWVT